MQKREETKKIYIVVSQTGSMLSRIIKIVTSCDYSHSSISTCEDLREMYSFGRKHAYNPFIGGFVSESVYYGTMKRFKNTRSIIVSLEVDEETYEQIEERLHDMYSQKENYNYDILGLFLASMHINYVRKNKYYCSEFVRDVLVRSQVDGYEELKAICHPMDFIGLPNAEVIYAGRLNDYPLMYQE